MGGAFVAELIDTFGEDARELIATLRRALAAADLDAFRRAAHSLKSTSESLGAAGLAALARELETMARAGNLRRGRRPARAARRASTRSSPQRSGSSDVASPRNAQAGDLLVVDDNRVNRLLLGRALEQLGHTVTFAENGREALEALRQRRVDLVLLDIEMPEMDGYQVLEALAADPHLRDIPVVMMSSVEEVDSVARCIEMGAEDYLFKPVNPVLLRGPRRRQPGEEAAPRPAARAVPEVRHRRGGGGAPDDRARAGRQARRGHRDVLRHPLVHEHHRGAVAGRHDRAPEQLLHAHVRRDRRPRRHRQPDARATA